MAYNFWTRNDIPDYARHVYPQCRREVDTILDNRLGRVQGQSSWRHFIVCCRSLARRVDIYVRVFPLKSDSVRARSASIRFFHIFPCRVRTEPNRSLTPPLPYPLCNCKWQRLCTRNYDFNCCLLFQQLELVVHGAFLLSRHCPLPLTTP